MRIAGGKLDETQCALLVTDLRPASEEKFGAARHSPGIVVVRIDPDQCIRPRNPPRFCIQEGRKDAREGVGRPFGLIAPLIFKRTIFGITGLATVPSTGPSLVKMDHINTCPRAPGSGRHRSRGRVHAGMHKGLGLCRSLRRSSPWDYSPLARRKPRVTAIDIALEPDAIMVERAEAANAGLLKVFSEGFVLDATHHPHITAPATVCEDRRPRQGLCRNRRHPREGDNRRLEAKSGQVILHPLGGDRSRGNRYRADKRSQQVAAGTDRYGCTVRSSDRNPLQPS